MDVNMIAVIGAGTMGRGIAYAAAAAGYRTILEDISAPVLDEGLTVQIGNRVVQAEPGEEFVVAAEEPHRISNARDLRGRVLEVAYGYTTEDDSFRLQDDYGRPLEPEW